jgi:DNA-binding MarR family transcriptional regulator
MPQLVAAGWVRTAAGPGRRILVSLTDAGADLVRRAGDELDDEVVALFADPRLAATGIDQAVLGRQVRLLTSLVQERQIP